MIQDKAEGAYMCRELEKHPDVLVPAMPHRPSHYAAMEAVIAPRPRTRKMIGMMSVIAAAILLIILGYSAVGFSGYLAFPRSVSSNALNNFSDRDILMQVGLQQTNKQLRWHLHSHCLNGEETQHAHALRHVFHGKAFTTRTTFQRSPTVF